MIAEAAGTLEHTHLDAQREKMLGRLFAAGLSKNKIAAELKVCRTTVWERRKKWRSWHYPFGNSRYEGWGSERCRNKLLLIV